MHTLTWNTIDVITTVGGLVKVSRKFVKAGWKQAAKALGHEVAETVLDNLLLKRYKDNAGYSYVQFTFKDETYWADVRKTPTPKKKK
jgi:hypothetical protein